MHNSDDEDGALVRYPYMEDEDEGINVAKKSKTKKTPLKAILPRGKNDAKNTSASSGEGENRHQCQQCELTFSTSGNLNRHVLTHTGDRPFKCLICSTAFTQKGNLMRHLTLHNGFSNDSAEKVRWRMNKKKLLKNNKRSVALIKRKGRAWQCEHCPAVFSHSSSYYRHVRTHTEGFRHACDICDAAFSRSDTLKTHVKRVHPDTNGETSLLAIEGPAE